MTIILGPFPGEKGPSGHLSLSLHQLTNSYHNRTVLGAKLSTTHAPVILTLTRLNSMVSLKLALANGEFQASLNYKDLFSKYSNHRTPGHNSVGTVFAQHAQAPAPDKSGILVCAYNLSTHEVGAGKSGDQDHL